VLVQGLRAQRALILNLPSAFACERRKEVEPKLVSALSNLHCHELPWHRFRRENCCRELSPLTRHTVDEDETIA